MNSRLYAGDSFGQIEADRQETEQPSIAGLSVPARSWAVSDTSYRPVPGTVETLPAGFYNPEQHPMFGPQLTAAEVELDTLVDIDGSVSASLAAEVSRFWRSDEAFRDAGFAQKRGILLHGPAGSGKTSIIMLLARRLIREQSGIVLLVRDPGVAVMVLQAFRQIEPDRPVMVVFEDVETLIRQDHQLMLSYLDGEFAISRVLNIATTNYTDELEARVIDRPGRFDRVELVGMPSNLARDSYIAKSAPGISDDQRARWVDASDGWSIAYLRELIVSVSILKEPEASVIERLRGLQNIPNRDSLRKAELEEKMKARPQKERGRGWDY